MSFTNAPRRPTLPSWLQERSEQGKPNANHSLAFAVAGSEQAAASTLASTPAYSPDLNDRPAVDSRWLEDSRWSGWFLK